MTLRGLLSFTGTSTMGSSSRGSDPDEADHVEDKEQSPAVRLSGGV
jgi:hypothetical protein